MEEMLDTFDINGNFLSVKPKSFCHGKYPNCYHKTVWIWIVNTTGKVLVQLRSSQKSFMPNKWDISCAGHIMSGEDIIFAAQRELKEELGLTVLPEDLSFQCQILSPSLYELGQIFILRADIDVDSLTLQKEEVEAVKWLSYSEFVACLYSDVFVDHDKNCKDAFERIIKEFI